jgi:predicted DCC family thiol-disulfide oxidoreductase YuxK
VAFGLVLLGDLLGRLRWARDLYSNEGILPNHNHLFNLRGKQEVWSLLHAFSTPGDAYFALALVLIVYVLFLIGYRTRVFHVLALMCLVSLTSRNILLEGAGNYAAIALLAFTAFLPCGSRFSLDSIRASMKRTDEKTAADLNDRTPPSAEAVESARLPGWSPATIAALAVLLQIAAIYACSALQQNGEAWRDGSALHYALHVHRWVSDLGARVRDAIPPGGLRTWTRALRGVEMAIPALLFVPALFRWTRTLAAALMLFHGLTLGLLFDFGLFGWSLVAAAALVLPGEAWDSLERRFREGRARTVIYDVDCGVCLWLARLLKRADLRGHLTFQGNDSISNVGDRSLASLGRAVSNVGDRSLASLGRAVDELLVRSASGSIERVSMPKEITAELVARTAVAVDRKGRVYTRGRAVTETLIALPFGWLALPLRLPGISHALDALYDVVAARRQRISVLMGKEACSIDDARPAGDEGDEAEADEGAPRSRPVAQPAPGTTDAVSPARRTVRLVLGSLRELAAAVVLASMLAQTATANPVPKAVTLPQTRLLAAVASWPRMLARWDLMAPEPPRETGMLVIDGQTRSQQAVDPMTGREPQPDLKARGPMGMGQPWADYVDRIRRKEWSEFQKAFREYLSKGGPAWPREPRETQITGYDAYWITVPIPPPGAAAAGEGTREKLFSHSRGGAGNLELNRLPLVKPGTRKQE